MIQSHKFNLVATMIAFSLLVCFFNCSGKGDKGGQTPLYSSLKPRIISMDIPKKDDGRGGLIVSDLDADRALDFIVSKPGFLAAYTNGGEKLWVRKIDLQITQKSEANGLPGWHAPGIQAVDLDGNMKAEIVFLTSNKHIRIISGDEGNDLANVPLEPMQGTVGWEHLVIANFRGKGDRDILLQATNAKGYRMGRYIVAYSIDDLLNQGRKAEALWRRDDFIAAAHSGARVADLDGDGLDEILGATIIGPDGEILIRLPNKGHIDAIQVDDIQPQNRGLEVVALEEGGENRIFPNSNRLFRLVNRIVSRILPGGNHVFIYNHQKLISKTHFKHQEPQNAAIGNFDLDTPGLEIWCRSRYDTHQKPFVFNSNGNLIRNYEMDEVAPEGWTPKGVEVIYTINWDGSDRQLAAAKERHKSGDVAIFDPLSGEFLHRFKEKADRIYVADVEGDWREELIVMNENEIHIYRNKESSLSLNHKRLWRRPHYLRSKMTYNYYNP